MVSINFPYRVNTALAYLVSGKGLVKTPVTMIVTLILSRKLV